MDDTSKIIAMYERGMSCREIGALLGRSHQYPYRRLKKIGFPIRPSHDNKFHKQWKGGRVEAGQGYWRQWIPADDPMTAMRDHHGYVKEHRLVLARKIGRPLLPSETVHHIDGNKSNNADTNLELRQGKHGKHIVMRCMDCGSLHVRPDKLAGEA